MKKIHKYENILHFCIICIIIYNTDKQKAKEIQAMLEIKIAQGMWEIHVLQIA